MMPKLINRIQRNNINGFIDEKKKKPLIERKGDWSCPKCRNLNFAFRTNCNRCQLSKNEADLIKNFTMMNGNEHHPQIMSPNDYEYQKFLNPNQINIYNTYYTTKLSKRYIKIKKYLRNYRQTSQNHLFINFHLNQFLKFLLFFLFLIL